MEQPQYNMLHREKVEVEYSQIYKTVGLGTTIWSPLASGYLTGKYINAPEKNVRLKREELGWLADRLFTPENEQKVKNLMTFAADHGFSLPQLGIAWCLKNENVSTVILGATKSAQLQETLKSADLIEKLTPEIMSDIEQILQNKPIHPQY